MNILLVSECTKNALKESRRVLDQFAERTGQRTWQTPITQKGLETLQGLLRKTARKNTAVACFWTRGKNQTELLWIVGDRAQFNERGRVPTNRTKRNIIRATDENSWKDGVTIQILATLAALLHDLGKATKGFQNKLQNSIKGKGFDADPYRHEWISLQLFKLMIKGCDTNEALLERLANFGEYQVANPDWHKALTSIDKDKGALDAVPPIGQLIGWLIVSHHRLPYYGNYDSNGRECAKSHEKLLNSDISYFYKNISALENWVKNSHKHPKKEGFWEFDSALVKSEGWLAALKYWSSRALQHKPLLDKGDGIIDDPFIFHLSRLSLMVGDYNYSSLPLKSNHNLSFQSGQLPLIANTDRKSKLPKQTLSNHLTGVARFTERFARFLPQLYQSFPSLGKKPQLIKPVLATKFPEYAWQNSAYNLAKSLAIESEEQGFFGLNMASTGKGKTFANCKIAYALGNEKQGSRFTIALGLRILTLQTGEALQKGLDLKSDELATLVGGSAVRDLFQLNKEGRDSTTTLDNHGSESLDELFDGTVYGETLIDDHILGTLIEEPSSKKLLISPVVTCTIDHLMGASETKRGGKHIVPILRLLTSDLILDEVDDFNQEDLPALSRLIYLAGLFGSRVILSSATLTPDLTIGLYEAYASGRRVWNQNKGYIDQLPVTCAWFDEFSSVSKTVNSKETFSTEHYRYVSDRADCLRAVHKKGIKHQAKILSVNFPSSNEIASYKELAKSLLMEAYALHQSYHNSNQLGEKVSVGLIRIANIRNIIPLAQVCFKVEGLPENIRFHIVPYHSRQLLLLRNNLEVKLDRILNRKNPAQLFQHPEINDRIKAEPTKEHIFIVIGSPVTEVGRDHDYDWAIVEPSSMRSLIQLAGRIWRHRDQVIKEGQPNITLLSSNFRSTGGKVGTPAFKQPGFESAQFLLASHDSDEILRDEELTAVNSIPRIISVETFKKENGRYCYLSDLEHAVIKALLNNEKTNYVSAYWNRALSHHLTAHLPMISPFRVSTPEEGYCYIPDEFNKYHFVLYDNVKSGEYNLNEIKRNSDFNVSEERFNESLWVSSWLMLSIDEELDSLLKDKRATNKERIAREYLMVNLRENSHWNFHSWLGFWKQSV